MLKSTITNNFINTKCPGRENRELKIRGLLILSDHHHVQRFDRATKHVRNRQVTGSNNSNTWIHLHFPFLLFADK